MLPTAGLYLPETLHRKQDTTTEKPETKTVTRKYFDRKPKLFDRKSFDRKPATTARKSMDDVSNAFSSLSTVFNFVDFAIARDEVSSENKVFVNLIHRVRHDVNEASRLRTCPAVISYCDLVPDRQTWIDAILLDVRRALNDIGIYLENVRVTGDGGVVALKQKFEWALSHHQKLLTREISLSMCHQSLMAAIQVMQQVEMGGRHGSYELEGTTPDPYRAPSRPWLQDEGGGSILRSPYSRQKWRLSQRNLSLPSIMVSEPEENKFEALSLNDIPIELPGSTPEDLPDPDNWDLYAPPLKPQRSFDQITSQRSLDQLRPQTSLGQPQSQTSFDESQSRSSFDYVRPRAFSDQIRPRASADQIRPRPSLEEYKSRASFDQISPLPILTEKRVARNDSSASISNAATIPLQAKRYRPRAVNVRKLPTKHQSLPSETQLPFLPTQPSLIMELSRWVLPSAQGSDPSTDTFDTPPTSVTSSPVIPGSPASCPEAFRPVPSMKSMTTVSAPNTPQLVTNILPSPNVSSPLKYDAQILPEHPPLELVRMDSQPKSTISTASSPTDSEAQKSPQSSIRSIHSIPRRPVPSAPNTPIQIHLESKETTPNSQELSSPHRPNELDVESKPERPRPTASTSEASTSNVPALDATIPVATALEMATGVKPPLSEPSPQTPTPNHSNASPTSNAPTTNTISSSAPAKNILAEKSPEAILPTPSSPATNAPMPTMPIANGPTGSTPTANVPRPIIAQSKRRAAHARRMQLAYGSG